MKKFKDAGHLFRLAAVFLAGAIAFLVLRSFLVPGSFGQYGQYRGKAIAEIAALPVSYAGHQVCEGCHTDVLDVKSKGVHKGVGCESCHGHSPGMPTIPLRSSRRSWIPPDYACAAMRVTPSSRRTFAGCVGWRCL